MDTITGPLGPDKTERYMNGDCYLLASALHDITGGWERLQLKHDDLGRCLRCSEFTGHAMVRMPNGKLLDAEGVHEDCGDTEQFHDDIWWPLDRPDDELRFVNDEIRADAAELLAKVGWHGAA